MHIWPAFFKNIKQVQKLPVTQYREWLHQAFNISCLYQEARFVDNQHVNQFSLQTFEEKEKFERQKIAKIKKELEELNRR